MKKFNFIFILLFVFSMAQMSFGQAITGSLHDFKDGAHDGWNPMPGEICAPCHQPHNGTNAAGNILWSGTLANSGDFTMYTSGTLAGTGSAAGSSLMCLGCHDATTTPHTGFVYNTVALDEANTTLGQDLSGSHPIGVADPGVVSGFQTPTGGAKYVGGKVECGSCHNPHDNTTVAGGNFMLMSNVASDLCLDCHDK